jgi:hypothetical protein
MSDFRVRIDRSSGSLEVSGEDKSWVNEKLTQLEYVYKEVPPAPVIVAAASQSATGSSANQKPSPSSNKVAVPKITKKGGAGKGKRPEINEELQSKLTREVIADLNAFIAERNKAYSSSLPAQAIIIATFLEDNLSWKGVDKHDLFTVYRQLGAPSGNTDSQLRNSYARNHYFSHIEAGKYMPSGSGDTFARHGSLNG